MKKPKLDQAFFADFAPGEGCFLDNFKKHKLIIFEQCADEPQLNQFISRQ